MPPIPVTLLMVLWFELFVVMDLKAKPKQNEVANATVIKVIFFTALIFYCLSF
jgi:hypothetical protein